MGQVIPHTPWPDVFRAAAGGLFGVPATFNVDAYGMDVWRARRVSPIFDWLYQKWFRVRALGLENLEGEGPRMLVANRAGFLPWDAAMISVAAGSRKIPLRPLLEAELFRTSFLGLFLNRMGALPASRENAERLLAEKRDILVFPEGRAGARRPIYRRRAVGSFGRGGFVRIARRMGARLIPVAVAGSQSAHPLLGNLALSSEDPPSIPLTPTFPWLGPLGLLPLPGRWTLVFGEEVEASDFSADEASAQAADLLRSRVQAMLDELR